MKQFINMTGKDLILMKQGDRSIVVTLGISGVMLMSDNVITSERMTHSYKYIEDIPDEGDTIVIVNELNMDQKNPSNMKIITPEIPIYYRIGSRFITLRFAELMYGK